MIKSARSENFEAWPFVAGIISTVTMIPMIHTHNKKDTIYNIHARCLLVVPIDVGVHSSQVL